jgi:hypothetical protein
MFAVEERSINEGQLGGSQMSTDCNRACGHQDPFSFNGRSYGQMGSGNHSGTGHFDLVWIYHVLDHQFPYG